MPKSIAIITARGGSKRIPRKNIREFCGMPIISYSIKAALESGCFDEVMVSTDDEEIANLAKNLGAQVPFLRSQKNSDDFSTTADVLTEVLETYQNQGREFDFTCCIYPTAVFVTAEKLQKAYQIFIATEADSLIPVVKFSYPIQRALKVEDDLLKFFWPENIQKRSQDLEQAYHDCGQFYFLKSAALLASGNIFTANSIPFEINETESQDIDTQMDWELAEIKYKILKTKHEI